MLTLGMFEFGRDSSSLALNGIVTCMGVFYQTQQSLFGVHVPLMTANVDKIGCDRFVQYVQTMSVNHTDGNPYLYSVINGTNRYSDTKSWSADILPYVQGLNYQGDVVLIRLKKNLGYPNMNNLSNGGKAAAVVCSAPVGGLAAGGECSFIYKDNNTVMWASGATCVTHKYRGQDNVVGKHEVIAGFNAGAGWFDVEDNDNAEVLRVKITG